MNNRKQKNRDIRVIFWYAQVGVVLTVGIVQLVVGQQTKQLAVILTVRVYAKFTTMMSE